jgi:hypothetical protein
VALSSSFISDGDQDTRKSGLKLKIADGDNPIYAIKYGKNEHPIIGFLKLMMPTLIR